ncbi:hypothetical protein [uncultured Kordia sp.]|uniref:hypothetical protein n=1 Tax=uncultured Kordia sp. TaxID=507699 RepID=UPI00260BF94B|nr:hypothetical protein [uncultured Kordia sp.]
MKKIIYSLALLLISCNVFSQNLSQDEFGKIDSTIKNIAFSIDESDDLQIFISKFNLSKTDASKVEKLTQKENIKFTKSKDTKSYILPFFTPTDNPNELKVTIFSFTQKTRRQGEKFHRGKYHFILTSTVGFENGKLVYKNSKFITDSKSINKWFLGTYKSYVKKTGPIFDKYKYTPPPPPPPPTSLR